jgi:hypothetical protein
MVVRVHKVRTIAVVAGSRQWVGSSGDMGRYRVVVRPGICICGPSNFVNRFGGR